MSSQLTDNQEKFLELIFLPEYKNNYAKAAVDAGYSPTTPVTNIVKSVKQEILERVDLYLALNAPKAANSVLDVLDNSDAKGAKAKLEASAMILDRVGISKKERLEIEHKSANGILILPAKKD